MILLGVQDERQEKLEEVSPVSCFARLSNQAQEVLRARGRHVAAPLKVTRAPSLRGFFLAPRENESFRFARLPYPLLCFVRGRRSRGRPRSDASQVIPRVPRPSTTPPSRSRRTPRPPPSPARTPPAGCCGGHPVRLHARCGG